MRSSLTKSLALFQNHSSSDKPKPKPQTKFGLKRAKGIRDKDSKDVNRIKDLQKKDTIFVPDEDLEKKLTQIKKEQEKSKRSYSNDIDSQQMRRFITQKQYEYLYEDKNKESLNNIILVKEDEDLEIEIFETDVNIYDKNTKQYLFGKCFIDQNYTFYFTPDMNNNIYFNILYYTFPLLSIVRCETNSSYFGPSKYCKEILLKDNRNFVLRLNPKSFDIFNEIIDKYALPVKSENYFNYAIYFKKLDMNKNKKNIKIYNLIDEFKRQDIDFKSNKQFRILNNNDFKLCATYPKSLIVPYDMSDEELKKSSQFRTKERLPTLTYRYKKNGNCIWRSSQTKSGFKGSNQYDILLLSKISNNQKLFVYDARPLMNAYANKFKGGGYENIDNYKNKNINIELIFCGMSNIHAVRSSYFKLLNTVSYNINNETTLFTNIANSGWYEAIIILLKSSFQIYNSVITNNNILIHCSDGWDRTSQLCSMSQILLDKYYRTLDGFICLIEKDWLSFGHQFRYRNGMYSTLDSPPKVSNDNQFSPIFLQWLDSLYQLMDQNYTKFQFNFNLILFLAKELYTGNYGTFLFNNDKEREECGEEKNTVSIWNYIKENEEKFINYIYNPEDNGALIINYKNIKIWSDYFFMFERDNSRYCIEEYNKKLKKYEDKESNIIDKLSKFIANKCNKEDIEGLPPECKKYVKKYIKK